MWQKRKIAIKLIFSYLIFLATKHGVNSSNIYDIEVKTIKGDRIDMSMYRGKVLLIVNVASECGYTDQHYRELNELYNIFKEDPFAILAFPCNQFGNQEPKRNSAVERFVQQNYQAKYQLFSKIQVIGENAHPLYKWLKSVTGVEPYWNFCKYLIDKEGNVVKFQPSDVAPMAMFEEIDNLISTGTGSDDKQKVEL